MSSFLHITSPICKLHLILKSISFNFPIQEIALSIDLAGPSKTASTPSPVLLTSLPLKCSIVSCIILSCLFIFSDHRLSPISGICLVESSISVNKIVARFLSADLMSVPVAEKNVVKSLTIFSLSSCQGRCPPLGYSIYFEPLIFSARYLLFDLKTATSSLECNTKTGKFMSGKLARMSTLVSNSRMLSSVLGLHTIRSNFAKSNCLSGIF